MKTRKVLDRIFETATRPFELFNGLVFMAYALVFWVDGADLYSHHIYAKFQEIPLWFTVGVFAVLGFLQFCLAWRNNPNSNIVSGYITLLCGGLWFLVCLAFVAPYPPLNTGMVHSALMCLACVLCGKRLIDNNKIWKYLIEKQKGL